MNKKIIIITLIIVIPALLFIRDIYSDRQHNILIKEKIPVYANWENYDINSNPIFFLTPDQKVSVKRIRHSKSFMFIQIEDNNKNNGWIIHGDEILLTEQQNS